MYRHLYKIPVDEEQIVEEIRLPRWVHLTLGTGEHPRNGPQYGRGEDYKSHERVLNTQMAFLWQNLDFEEQENLHACELFSN